MNRSFFRWAALACASATLALTSAGASAQATIQLNDTNCSDFSLGGSPGARTLTCLVSAPPVCSVTGPTVGTINGPITLTASCSPAATGWAWTGGNCGSTVTQQCVDTESATGTVTYTVTGSNSSGSGPKSAGYNVLWSSTPPSVPTGCTISGAPTGNQTSGVSVTLTVNCTGGGQPVSWSWTGAGTSGMTTQSTTPITVTATTTFTATACSTPAPATAGTCMTTPAVTVQIGSTGGIVCNGFAGGTVVLNIPYDDPNGAAYTVAYSSTAGTFAPNGALVLVFTTPAVATPPQAVGRLTMSEYGSPPAVRQGALSTTPCDFTVGLTNVPGVTSLIGNTEDISDNFTINWEPSHGGSYIKLLPSTTYYVNLFNPDGCSPSQSCDVKFQLSKVPGT